MAVVIHTIKGNQYAYEHHRVGDKVVCDYIGVAGGGGGYDRQGVKENKAPVPTVTQHKSEHINKIELGSGKIIQSKFTYKELWENAKHAENYKEGTDASHLIGKDYLSWSNNKLVYHELKMIKIKDIKKGSESLDKEPIYKEVKTQAPPIDVDVREYGYRITNGHRRLASAKARGEKEIFAEIMYV